jgi:hypothetical protein
MVTNHLEVENKLHEHIRILKIQLKEKDDMIAKLRKEKGLPIKTTWVEKNG